jgi:OmpA-OmpF porin, OOP family
MRNFKISLCAAATMLASPALAGDGVYIGVDAGAVSVNDISLDIGVTNNSANISSGKGYDIGIVAGYDFGKFRLEAEASSRSADSAGINVVLAGVPLGSAPTVTGIGVLASNGRANAQSLMANAMFDLGRDDGLQAFVGGGIGIAKVRVKNVIGQPVWLQDSDEGFAWQALAGVRYPMNDHIDVGLKYRFFNGPRVELTDRLGRDVVSDFSSHSIMASVSYNFGEGRK